MFTSWPRNECNDSEGYSDKLTLCRSHFLLLQANLSDSDKQGPGEADAKFVSLWRNVSRKLLSVVIVLEPPRTICIFF